MSFLEKSNSNERKALVRVLEIDKSGNFEKEVLGFGVKMKKDDENDTFMFITSSSVLKSSEYIHEGSKIVAERYCSKYPSHIDQKDHREEIYKVTSSVDDDVSFVFFKGSSEKEFLEIDDGSITETLPIRKTLHAYAFEGKDLVELTFQDKHSSNDYKLANVSKRGFQVKQAKGAPVIAYDKLSEKPYVVGILHIKKDGTLYPVFLTENKLEVKSEIPTEQQGDDDSKDEKDSLIINVAENGKSGLLPAGGAEGNNSNGKTEEDSKDEKDSPIINVVENGKAGLLPAGGAEGNNSNGKTEDDSKDEKDRLIINFADNGKSGLLPAGGAEGNNSNGKIEEDSKDEKDSPIINNAENGKADLLPAGDAEGNKGNARTDALVMDKPDRTIIHGHPIAQDTKEILVVTGKKQKEEKTSTPVFQEESKCFKFKTINEALPDQLKRKLQTKLDPDRPFGGDIASLADKYGYTLEEINYLKTRKNPTQELLQEKGDSTLLCLRDKLREIERYDAAKLIDNHIRENCDCEECGSLR